MVKAKSHFRLEYTFISYIKWLIPFPCNTYTHITAWEYINVTLLHMWSMKTPFTSVITICGMSLLWVGHLDDIILIWFSVKNQLLTYHWSPKTSVVLIDNNTIYQPCLKTRLRHTMTWCSKHWYCIHSCNFDQGHVWTTEEKVAVTLEKIVKYLGWIMRDRMQNKMLSAS